MRRSYITTARRLLYKTKKKHFYGGKSIDKMKKVANFRPKADILSPPQYMAV
jgi:hypothetical protein